MVPYLRVYMLHSRRMKHPIPYEKYLLIRIIFWCLWSQKFLKDRKHSLKQIYGTIQTKFVLEFQLFWCLWTQKLLNKCKRLIKLEKETIIVKNVIVETIIFLWTKKLAANKRFWTIRKRRWSREIVFCVYKKQNYGTLKTKLFMSFIFCMFINAKNSKRA